MDYKRILTLHYTGGMSGREIAEATGVGKTISTVFPAVKAVGEGLTEKLAKAVTSL